VIGAKWGAKNPGLNSVFWREPRSYRYLEVSLGIQKSPMKWEVKELRAEFPEHSPFHGDDFAQTKI
jgi:hypothetical protein